MSTYQQLIFYQETREEQLQREIDSLREQVDKSRKSQFAKIGKMMKMYEEIKQDHEYFKIALCRKTND